MHLRRFIALALAVASLIAASAIGAAAASLASFDHPPVSGPWSLAPGEYYVDLSGSSYQTSTVFGADGKLATLPGTSERRTFRSYVELGWKKSWSVQFSVPFTTQTEVPAAGAASSATGLGDLSVGLRRSLTSGPSAAALQLTWEAPAGNNPWLQPQVSDGLQKLSGTLQLGGPVGRIGFWQLGGGYRFQFNDANELKDEVSKNPESFKWPQHMVSNGGLAVWLGKLQASGNFAVDASSFRSLDYPRTVTSVAVGGRLTYRTDARLDVFAGSWHSPSGVNAPALDEYYAGIAWKATKLNRIQGFLGGDARP